jgi:hypothetical protein
MKTGNQITRTISGGCSGTEVETNSAAYSGKNGAGVTGLIINNSFVDTISASSPKVCSTKLFSGTGSIDKNFYDATTLLPASIGYSPQYYVYGSQQSLPTSVTAGSAGTIYTYQDYNGTSSPVSSAIVTYAVSADSASTLLYTVTETSTLVSGAPYFTVATTYRLNANNTLSEISQKAVAYNTITGIGDLAIRTTVVR